MKMVVMPNIFYECKVEGLTLHEYSIVGGKQEDDGWTVH